MVKILGENLYRSCQLEFRKMALHLFPFVINDLEIILFSVLGMVYANMAKRVLHILRTDLWKDTAGVNFESQLTTEYLTVMETDILFLKQRN